MSKASPSVDGRVVNMYMHSRPFKPSVCSVKDVYFVVFE